MNRFFLLLLFFCMTFQTGCFKRYIGYNDLGTTKDVREISRTPTGEIGDYRLDKVNFSSDINNGASFVCSLFQEKEFIVDEEIEFIDQKEKVYLIPSQDGREWQTLLTICGWQLVGGMWFIFEAGWPIDYDEYVEHKPNVFVVTYQTLGSLFNLYPNSFLSNHDFYHSTNKIQIENIKTKPNTRNEFFPIAIENNQCSINVYNSQDRVVYYTSLVTDKEGKVHFDFENLPDSLEENQVYSMSVTAEVEGQSIESSKAAFAKVLREPQYIPDSQLADYLKFDEQMLLAKAGDLQAMDFIAQAYANGVGTLVDFQQASDWKKEIVNQVVPTIESHYRQAFEAAYQFDAETYNQSQWNTIQKQWESFHASCHTGIDKPVEKSIVNEISSSGDQVVVAMSSLAEKAETNQLSIELTSSYQLANEMFKALHARAKIVATDDYTKTRSSLSKMKRRIDSKKMGLEKTRETLVEINTIMATIQSIDEKTIAYQSSSNDSPSIDYAQSDSSSSVGNYLSSRKIAIVVGIDQYQHQNTLHNAVNDARDVAGALEEYYDFDDVRLLVNEDATKRQVLASIRGIVDELEGGEDVFVYYAGHGYLDKTLDEGYWITVESQSQSQFLSNAEIHRYIQAMSKKAGHILVVSDSCFSGSLLSGMRDARTVGRVRQENAGSEDNGWIDRLYQDKSRHIFTSGGIRPVEDGGGDGHSVFAYYLLKALRDPDHPVFTGSELAAKVSRLVGDNSEQSPRFGVIRFTGHEGGEFVFARR